MRRLFLDVDDSLVLWQGHGEEHPYGLGATEWKPNQDLVSLAKGALQEKMDVIVWSGGGQTYADLWAYRLFNDSGWYDYVGTSAKLLSLPAHDDIVVDDQPIKTLGRHYYPNQVDQAREALFA